jgi:nickel-dependent lactate racemase
VTATREEIQDLDEALRATGAPLVAVTGNDFLTSQTCIPRAQLLSKVADVLSNPVEYPPFAQAIVPGDQVAIAADESTPCLPEVVAGAVDYLVTNGITIDSITVVTRCRQVQEQLSEFFTQLSQDSPRVVIHDPADQNLLCFVGMTEDGNTLLVNRTLYEADIILPIGCARLEEVPGHAGLYDSLYPRFSDAKTVKRWQSPAGFELASHTSWQRLANASGWLLGVPLVLKVVPGLNGNIMQLLAGDSHTVAHRANELCRSLWARSVPSPASLVIATISGSDVHHSWENVARAMRAAKPLLVEGGALAICCPRLSTKPKSIRQLATPDDLGTLQSRLQNDAENDTWSAWELLQALDEGPVYLMSDLKDEMIEDLGIAPVRNITEFARLASRHESCIVLSDAHHVVATVSSLEDFEDQAQ